MVANSRKCNRSSNLLLLAALVLALSAAAICIAAGEPDPAKPTPQDSQPVWSPDGKTIAFVSTRNLPDGGKVGDRNIWTVNADGTNLKQITTRGVNLCPTWSPDGGKIAFQSDKQIWQLELSTNSFTQLTEGDRGWYSPDWHPKDISKMACCYKESALGDDDIFAINPQTCKSRESGHRVVREREGSDECCRWSRDGKMIAFVGEVIEKSSRNSLWYLMTMNSDGTSLKTFCELPGPTCRASWNYDNTALYITGGKVCDLTTGKMNRVLGEGVKDPDVSPDGKLIAFAEYTASGQFIFVSKLDGTEKKQVAR